MVAENLGNSVSNNAIMDPLQGYDADVWVIDQATGAWILTGRFTTIELVFRNTTRPYIELGQRVMRQLDGTFMMGWTMERGQLDGRVLQQTFGYSKIGRGLRVNRHPRMQITFQVNSPELHEEPNSPDKEGLFSDSSNANLFDGVSSANATSGTEIGARNAESMVILKFCKVETFTLRAEAGDEILSNRWEGVAEGYEVINGASVWGGQYLNNSNTQATQSAAELVESNFRTTDNPSADNILSNSELESL